MTVKDLKLLLDSFDDNSPVILADWSNGREYDFTIDCDESDEEERVCIVMC